MNIWQFQDMLSRRLLRWASVSMALGVLFSFGSAFSRKLGSQFLGWGMVNAVIALWGDAAMRRRVDQYENPGDTTVHVQEARNLLRLLWINAILDIFYVIGGWLWAKRDKGDGKARGTGWGIILQGAALFIFDVIHALRLPRK